jgi:hypothetical protein
MKYMQFVRLLACLTLVSACFAESPKPADTPAAIVRGKLVQHENQPPMLETTEHKLIVLEGDGTTEHVLHDKRLDGDEFEALGHFTSADHFRVDPAYTHALHVLKDGKRLSVTYWCEICSIRQYEPGPCMCCQRETHLDLRELDGQ